MDGVDSNDVSAKLFLSWNGKNVSSSMVTAQLNSCWGKAVGHARDRPRVNPTLVRKSFVTKLHELCPHQTKALANLICHSESTARKTYFLKEKAKTAGSASANLRSILRQDMPGEEKDGDIDNIIKVQFSEEISE